MKQDRLHTDTDNLSPKTLARRALAGFSLIELMIVVVILGALVAIIIPQFNQSESEAKDTGCDASNYGTLRQMVNFRSINGVYPSRLHTGFESDASSAVGMGYGSGAEGGKLAPVTYSNLVGSSSWVTLDEKQAASLAQAGIVKLAYGGFGSGQDASFVSTTNGVHVATVTDSWLEDHDDLTTKVTVNGVELKDYIHSDPYDLTSTEDGIVVPLIAAPTAEFDHYYLNGSTSAQYDSKVGIGQVGACPWVEKGAEFPFYVCFFKVHDDGTAAKLIGTACPECGSLNP